MQSTLLGIAIALIVAFAAALVGPLFVDFTRYRAEFETRASELTGLDVHIAGPIDVRLLPTPTLAMQDVKIGNPGAPDAVEARKLTIELALNALVRGEWRISNARLEAAELKIATDDSGRLDWPIPASDRMPSALSIDEFDIADSRVIMADAASGGRLVLDNFEFTGEVKALTGPIRGDGSFAIAGERYPYHVLVGSRGDDATRLRLSVAPRDRTLTIDADGAVSIERGRPRFEGTLQLARPIERPADEQPGLNDRWRISTRIIGDSTAAALDQLEIEYGRDERPIRLHGDAKLAFGATPRLDGTLAAAQLDVDRLLGLPEEARRRPVNAVTTLADLLGGAKLPIAMKLGLSVDVVTLAGAPLQRVSGNLRRDADGWTIQSIGFRAPGLTQVQFSGRLTASQAGAVFAGPAKIESQNPRAFFSWLTDRGDLQDIGGPFRAEGEFTLGGSAIAADRLSAEMGRMSVNGRFAYSWPISARPARLDATLNAPEFDLDRISALGQGLFADTAFAWPREGMLALSFGKVSVAGIEGARADVNMQFAEQTIDINRLAIADFGGASVVANGRLDARTLAPRGTLAVDLAAASLDGVAALLERIAPAAADPLHRAAGQLAPVKLAMSLSLRNDPGDAAGTSAKPSFKIDGDTGAFRVSLQGTAEMGSGAVALADLARIGSAKADLAGSLDAADGSALVDLFGLDRIVVADKRAGHMIFKAAGALDGEMTVDARLTAGDLDFAANGTAQISGSPWADVMLNVAAAKLRTFRADETLPIALSGRMRLADGTASLVDLAGKVAETDVTGRLAFGLAQPATLDGELSLANFNLPAVIGSMIQVPLKRGAPQGGWPAEPFEAGVLNPLSAEIRISAAEAALSPKLAARNLRGTVRVNQSNVAFEDFDGTLASGRISGRVGFQRNAGELDASSHIRVENADAAQLMPGDGRPPLAGRLTVDVEATGAGRSAAALVGSLKGYGTLALADGHVARLDPAVFVAVVRRVDDGLSTEQARIRDAVEQALAGGALPVVKAQGTLAINSGRVRLTMTALKTQGADLQFGGTLDLVQNLLDAKLALTGSALTGTNGGDRPQIAMNFKGPIDSARRALDVAAFSSWLTRRAAEKEAARLEALNAARNAPTRPDVAAVPPAPAAPPAQNAPMQPKRAEEPAPTDKGPTVNPPPLAKPELAVNPPTEPAQQPQAAQPAPSKQAEAAPSPEASLSPEASPSPGERPRTTVTAPELAAIPPPQAAPPAAARRTDEAAPPASPPKPPATTNSKLAAIPANPVPPTDSTAGTDDPDIMALDQAIEANPGDAAALARRGQLFAIKSNFARALADFDAVIRLQPKNVEALNNRCWVRAIAGDARDALKDCNEALQIRPRFVDALDSRGFINLKIGQPRNAILDYDAALRVNPRQASSLYGRGIAKLRSGNAAEGMSDIAAAKAIKPDIAEEFAGYGIR